MSLGHAELTRNRSLSFACVNAADNLGDGFVAQSGHAVLFPLSSSVGPRVAPVSLSECLSPFGVPVGHVVALGAKKKMVGADASPIVASVKDKEAIWDRADVQFPRKPMRTNHYPRVVGGTNWEVTVPPRDGCGPLPAFAGFVDLRPKPFLVGLSGAMSVSSHVIPLAMERSTLNIIHTAKV